MCVGVIYHNSQETYTVNDYINLPFKHDENGYACKKILIPTDKEECL
jgi:hypothetical protein